MDLIQPVKKGEGGIWWVTGYNSLVEDGLYWYDDIVCYSDGLVEIMGTKIAYPRPLESEVKALLEKVSNRQKDMMMSRAVKCFISAKKEKYEDLRALCTQELAQEIEENIQGGKGNIYGGKYLMELKKSSADKPAMIHLPQVTANQLEYFVTL